MKQITTTKATIIAVEVPDNTKSPKVFNDDDKPYISYLIYAPTFSTQRVYLPVGKYEFLGIYSQEETLNENKAKEVVEDCPYYAKCWKKYNVVGEPEVGEFKHNYSCYSPIQSFESLMQVNGIYKVNPLGNNPPVLEKKDLWGNDEQDSQVYAQHDYQLSKWRSAQSKVKTVLILKLNK